MQTMRSFVSSLPLLVTASLLCAFAAPGCTAKASSDSAIQKVVDETAKNNPDIVRLSVHVSPDGKESNVVASTSDAKLGKPSDKEDLQAMTTGETVVLDEPNALDVTVPVLQKDGKYTTAIGVTLRAAANADKKVLKAKATEIANLVANAIATKK